MNKGLIIFLLSSQLHAAQTALVVSQETKLQQIEAEIKFNAAATQELIAAVQTNDVPAAQRALAQGANPNALILMYHMQRCYIYPAFHYALQNGWVEMLTLLAHAPGINLDVRPKDYVEKVKANGYFSFFVHCTHSSALELAVKGIFIVVIPRETQLAMVKILLEVGAWQYTQSFNTALVYLCTDVDDFEMIEALIHSGGNLNGVRNKNGKLYDDSIPLCWAIVNRDEKLMTALYSAGADIMMEDLGEDGDGTLLDYVVTCHNTNPAIVKYLLYIGSQMPGSFYDKIVSGEVMHQQLADECNNFGRCYHGVLRDVQEQKDKDERKRKVSEQTLVESSLLTDQLSRLVGQYICISAEEVTKEKSFARQQKASESDEKELACIQEERSAAAERAKKEKAATQHALVTLDFDDERKE